MEIENKLKAMGLELPAAGTPPPGRAGSSAGWEPSVRRRAHCRGGTSWQAGRGYLCRAGLRRRPGRCPRLFVRRKSRDWRLGQGKAGGQVALHGQLHPGFRPTTPCCQWSDRPAQRALRRRRGSCQVRRGHERPAESGLYRDRDDSGD